MQKIFCLFALLFVCSLNADPWGKDADLAKFNFKKREELNETTSVSSLARWGIKAIKFHQDIISPADGPRSNFIPSSSQYTLEAMTKYGFFRGYMMGCDRLMRENSDQWVYRQIVGPNGKRIKWDPIPKN